jgi:hypothetical protein
LREAHQVRSPSEFSVTVEPLFELTPTAVCFRHLAAAGLTTSCSAEEVAALKLSIPAAAAAPSHEPRAKDEDVKEPVVIEEPSPAGTLSLSAELVSPTSSSVHSASNPQRVAFEMNVVLRSTAEWVLTPQHMALMHGGLISYI